MIPAFALSLAYWAGAEWGLSLAFTEGTASPFWPAAGLALAALLRYGLRLWPAIAAGEMAAVIHHGVPWGAALGMGLGDALTAWAAAVSLARRCDCVRGVLSGPRALFAFLLWGAVLSPSISATLGTTSLVLAGLVSAGDALFHGLTWYLGDCVGTLMGAPLLLTWTGSGGGRGAGGLVERLAILGVETGLGVFLFWSRGLAEAPDIPIAFSLLPVMVWAAYRLGSRELTLGGFLLALIAVGGTARGYGPFTGPRLDVSLLWLESFLAIAGATTLLLHALVNEHRLVLARLRDHERDLERQVRRATAHLRLLLEASGEGIFGLDRKGRCTFVNPAAERLLGYPAADLLGRELHPLIHARHEDGRPCRPEDCPILASLSAGECRSGDDEVLWRRDGHPLPVQFTTSPLVEGARLRGAVVLFRDVTEERARRRRLDHLARHDALTGLPNRRAFTQRLAGRIETARGGECGHVLCYIDLDHFKPVNDSAGHAAGDQALRAVSHLLQRHLRRSDTLARLGGDEFGLLLDGCDAEAAGPVIEGLLQALRDWRFEWQGRRFRLGMSIGAVALDSAAPAPDKALKTADGACYRAKAEGGDRVC